MPILEYGLHAWSHEGGEKRAMIYLIYGAILAGLAVLALLEALEHKGNK
jgi:hypothetical protein